MPFVATETMACIGMSLCGSRLSARFQQLMQLVACDSLSMVNCWLIMCACMRACMSVYPAMYAVNYCIIVL